MEIIPAIDLKGGKCVRLLQGRDEATTEYSSDPVMMAEKWVSQGARRLHIVNLDGAFGRSSGHLEILRKIAARVDACLEYGGGLRTPADVEDAFRAGCDKVVLGTMAIENQDFLRDVLGSHDPESVIVALDAKNGKVTTRGWTDVAEAGILDAAAQMERAGVKEILYTDVARDGMMTGVDMETMGALCGTGLRVIASGGVASAEDIRSLVRLNRNNLIGAIVGKALYERRVSLGELIVAATSGSVLT